MPGRLKFILCYYFLWGLVFELCRLVFLLFNFSVLKMLPTGILTRTFIYGFKMDMAIAAYIILPVCLFVITGLFFPYFQKPKLYKVYTGILLFFVLIFTIVDLEVFRHWGFRLDATLLKYLQHPQEAWASISGMPILVFLLFFLLLYSGLFFLFNKFITFSAVWFNNTKETLGYKLPAAAFLLVLTSAFVIPMRGGLQLSPITQSSVCFSNNAFANSAAVNASWNFLDGVVNGTYTNTNPYHYMSANKAKIIVDSLYEQGHGFVHVLNTPEPNIIVIVWESFTAKASAMSINGREVTPCFNRLKKEGIYFSHAYASGDRTNKGLPAIFSGYPALPRGSVIEVPSKAGQLNSISELCRRKGYKTTFYYGGEPDFSNIGAYAVHAGFDSLVSKDDFDKKDLNSKWGAHDGAVMKRIIGSLNTGTQPFFTAWLTLSSHEPFEIPVNAAFKGNDELTRFMSTHHYTDACIDSFVQFCKKQIWWNKTLLIIVADHGHRLPESSDLKNFTIPMLWLGGALNQTGTVVEKYVSQVDVAATLSAQLGYGTSMFPFSRNIFDTTYKQWAFFTYTDRLGLMQPGSRFIFDNVSKSITDNEGTVTNRDIETGKALLQFVFDDYLAK